MLSDDLRSLLHSLGANLVGFADLREIPPQDRHGLPFGVSIAAAINRNIVSQIAFGPTSAYFDEYSRLNRFLDTLSVRAAEFLSVQGFHARPIAATNENYDPVTMASGLPHKTVATRAGLGWIGKHALLVTREFGSAVRLATVLTDAPLPVGKPVDQSDCGGCKECRLACPAQAIAGNVWQKGMAREALVDVFACRPKALELTARNFGRAESICGVCIAVCPWTKSYISGD